MSYTGKKFPNISVNAMNEMGDTFKINVLEEAQKNNKKVILFWYPKDFTFVCPTELHAFQAALPEFEKRNTIVIGASCDTTYPIIADSNRNLSNLLDILDVTNPSYDEETDTVQVEGDNVTYRATYIIDEEGTVVHESVNHMPLGRNVNEFLRLIDAYTHVQEKGEVCPANWEEGKDAMKPNAKDTASYLAAHIN